MKIAMNPMPRARQRAIARAEALFGPHIDHRSLAHAQKRMWAETLDARLQPEADLRRVTLEALAKMILSKPDNLAARELQRQSIMLRIEAAKTPEELSDLISQSIPRD